MLNGRAMLALLQANVGKAGWKNDWRASERIDGNGRGRVRRQRPVFDAVFRRRGLAKKPVVDDRGEIIPVRAMHAILAQKSDIRTVRGIDIPAVDEGDELTARTE